MRNPLQINASHSPCTSTNLAADLPCQHGADNDPSITLQLQQTRMILQQEINLF